MPRSKALMKKRAGGAGPSNKKKIVIKPFTKPPALPPNYYEQTSRELLDGTMNVVFQRSSIQGQSASSISLQNSYQQVVNLVSHQYGPRLYTDLVTTMQTACRLYVLPEDYATSGCSTASSSSQLLSYVQVQYQKYVDYLLLCKHVFLPLDRTHAWTTTVSATTVEKKEYPAAASTAVVQVLKRTTGDVSSGQGLWQVGLEQFRLRLQHFQLDEQIYQKWWESLQLDWDSSLPLDQQSLLQSTLYMWQDLGLLQPTLTKKLEPDLIQFFQTKSKELMTMNGDSTNSSGSTKYSAPAVISYCHQKWMHVAYHWSRFLPKTTCVSLLEHHLFQPHLQSEWLLNPIHLDPLLEEPPPPPSNSSGNAPSTPISASVAASASSSSGTTPRGGLTSIQQLWMLAGRLMGGYKLVANGISQFAKTRGLALMKAMGGGDSKIGKQKIAELLQLQAKLRLLLGSLPHSPEHCALKHVWEDVVNPSFASNSGGVMMTNSSSSDTNIVAEALAKYVDAYLKDAKKQEPDNNWAASTISGIFCYLQAKDVFEAFYKRDLAKRLLWNRIVSMDVERHFVSLLKAECGAGYTAKMEGMFQDMDWSRETMTRYKQAIYHDEQASQSQQSQLDMDIQVLTTGYWPVYPQFPNLILPTSLKQPQDNFSNYYKSKYQGRRMTWQYALGHVVVRFKPKETGPKYDLVVSLCQALVLLQFNNDEEMKTLPQLMAAVGLDSRDEMERILQSLCLGKEGTRVLQKRDYVDPSSAASGSGDEKKKIRLNVHDQDCFRVQSNFRSNQRRIRITNILMKETKEERDKTVEAVSRDRLYLIDAVLVRIMKARKLFCINN